VEKRDLFLQLVAAPLALHGHRFINLTSTAPYSRRYKGCWRIRRSNGPEPRCRRGKAMSDEWWCVQFGRQDGPMSLDELKVRLRDIDTREVFVWRDGFQDWKLVEDVPEVMPPRRAP